jgi:NAD dependent epimerase/dehydratase family enzyme
LPAIALRAALGDGVAELLLTGQRAVPRKLLEAGFQFELPTLAEALRDLK